MRNLIVTLFFMLSAYMCMGQNSNISVGNIFDGEPYLSIDPQDAQHMVVAWIGSLPFSNSLIKTKVSFDGGQSWGNENIIPHAHPLFGSADPCLDFDNTGAVFLSYVDFSVLVDSGAVYVAKSINGGVTWQEPVEVINVHADPGKYPSDRPWMSIDRSGGPYDGYIYVTTMNPTVFGFISPPYHPYLTVSSDGGNSFGPWQYLDSTDWLAGNFIALPMPSNAVSSSGVFHAVYPSWVFAQGLLPQYILASSFDGGSSFSYQSVLSTNQGIDEALAKKAQLLRCNPADPEHLAFFYLDMPQGDIDVFMRESFDGGLNWTDAYRLNDDPIANNRIQDLIWADFDADGDLVVSWRDRRNALDSTYTTSSEIWAVVRDKDSTNFSANFPITDQSIAYDSVLAASGNDFMCVKLVDDTLSAVWGDPRSGRVNIWFQRMSMSGMVMSTQQIASEHIISLKVYPNPAQTEIVCEAHRIQEVKLLDNRGMILREVSKQGYVERVKLSIEDVPSGTYFLQVLSDEGSAIEGFVKE